MRFEKWQALGNDYVIVEHDALPFAADARARPAAVRPPHRHRRGRGAGARRRPTSRVRRAAADLQPRRLRGRALGQRRARGDHVPAPPRLDRRRPRSRSRPSPGRSGRRSPGETTCTRRHGTRAADLARTPPGAGRPRASERGAGMALPARVDRQPAVRDPHADAGELDGAGPRRDRPGDRARRPASPTARNVSWFAEGARRIRARIFERGVGETPSGTGAAARRSPTCCRRRRARDRPARRRRARRRRRQALHVDLAGWAVPVYAGELAASCWPSSAAVAPARRHAWPTGETLRP